MSYTTLLVLSVAVILTVTVSVTVTSLIIRVVVSVVIVSCWSIGGSLIRSCGACGIFGLYSGRTRSGVLRLWLWLRLLLLLLRIMFYGGVCGGCSNIRICHNLLMDLLPHLFLRYIYLFIEFVLFCCGLALLYH